MPRGEIITITGHLGREPEDIVKDGNIIGIKFSVAVGHGYKNKSGEWVEGDTNWWTVTAFGPAATAVRAAGLHKGEAVRVQSREIVAKAYLDKTNFPRVDLSLKVWDGDIARVLYTPKDSSGGSYQQSAPGSAQFAGMEMQPLYGDAGSLRDEPEYSKDARDLNIPF